MSRLLSVPGEQGESTPSFSEQVQFRNVRYEICDLSEPCFYSHIPDQSLCFECYCASPLAGPCVSEVQSFSLERTLGLAKR